jgi:hypothetical protein
MKPSAVQRLANYSALTNNNLRSLLLSGSCALLSPLRRPSAAGIKKKPRCDDSERVNKRLEKQLDSSNNITFRFIGAEIYCKLMR